MMPHPSHTLTKTRHRWCLRCGRSGVGVVSPCPTPQTAGGASTRDQAISQAPPTREGPRGRPRPPVDVPAPPLPTTEETP
jgi:hypothetical protein